MKNQGDGWSYVLDAVGRFFEQVMSVEVQSESTGEFSGIIEQLIPQRAYQLGQRTAALHGCLASVTELPDFAPEPVTSLYQRSLYQTMRSQLRRTEVMVTRKLPILTEDAREAAVAWLAMTPRILDSYQQLLGRRIHLDKVRVHGDYHLGQVLNTGNDFVILDFEGELGAVLEKDVSRNVPSSMSWHVEVVRLCGAGLSESPETGGSTEVEILGAKMAAGGQFRLP